MSTNRQVKELRDRIGVGANVATMLLTLSGGDVDMATKASNESNGLDQCKANIIDKRFKKLEHHERYDS